jgi:predicted MPP superfamily phosphohydrolase
MTTIPRPKKTILRKMLVAVPALFVVLCLIDLLVEYRLVRVREFVIEDPDIPSAFHGYRIAFLTDIHYGPYLLKAQMAALVAQTNGLKPDLVLMGGDYVHQDPKYIQPCFDGLAEITAPDGVYGVLGNHDHWEGAAACRQAMKQNNIGVLDNQAFWLWRGKERIKIGGVGDLLSDIQVLDPTVRDATEADFVILVSHNPDFAERIRTKKLDLMLSGHTHGGQVTVFGLYAPLLPTTTGQKYRSGLVATPLLKVIISNGIGVITPPVRFFAPPEIVMVTLG